MSRAKTTVQRWDVHQRIQHAGLIISTSILILTGFPIKYHALPWAKTVTALIGGFDRLFSLHLAMAVLLVITSVYHLAYLIAYWSRFRAKARWSMVPGLNDLRDAWHHALHLIGVRRQPPRFGQYSYLEKFEYLAVFWGMVFMGGTGLALWFPVQAARYLPAWGLEAVRVIHSNEAFIAMLALVVGHFFSVHFHPGVFPNSEVWLTGRMSLSRFAEEHPAEADRLVSEGKLAAADVSAATEHEPAHRPLVLWLELAVYSAVVVWILLTFVPMLFA